MAAAMNPKRIVGKWISGYALDVHTISSTHLGINQFGHDVFDNKRSDLGELLYRMKYRGDRSAASAIVEAAVAFLRQSRVKFDLLVPVPPSGDRPVQPVLELAHDIGSALNLPVSTCISTTRPATQLKGVLDPERRRELLDGLYTVGATVFIRKGVRGERPHTEKKSILLFDDLYRSGATLNAITELLMTQGGAEAVRVLTITRTRVNQ